jgi:RNA polymerase sigma-70 factor (ECF subfamily)
VPCTDRKVPSLWSIDLASNRFAHYRRNVDELSALLTRAQQGDADALASFVHATHAPVWRFCAHLVGRDDADDATQETFVAAWRALPQFRGDASAKTWLFVIARRSAERVSRRRWRWLELADATPGPAPPSDPEQANELDALLSVLEPDRRMALLLTQVIGLTYAETAEVCDCAIGTIRSRVARAREELLQRRAAGPDARASGGC